MKTNERTRTTGAATVTLESVGWLGRGFLGTARGAGRMGIFLSETLFMVFVPPYRWRRVVERIHFLGVKTTFVILLTGAFAGMVLGLQVFYVLRKFGAESLLGPAVALSLVRELGPVFSALMITGRAGSALTAELGVMRISEQIDALDMMAIHPVQYLVVPNLLAGIVVFPVLTWSFDVVGIFGGYLVGVKLLGLAHGTYFGEIHTFLEIQDVLDGFYKSLCFGILVIWICCYKGYYAGYGAEGVSRATTEAVVLSSVTILLWDYLMGSFLF
jgi:phospholipid/cholesterol/gamma-HCH transport system permease protein